MQIKGRRTDAVRMRQTFARFVCTAVLGWFTRPVKPWMKEPQCKQHIIYFWRQLGIFVCALLWASERAVQLMSNKLHSTDTWRPIKKLVMISIAATIYGWVLSWALFLHRSDWPALGPGLWWMQQLWHAFRQTLWWKNHTRETKADFRQDRNFSLKCHSIRKETPSITIKGRRSVIWLTFRAIYLSFLTTKTMLVQYMMEQTQVTHRNPPDPTMDKNGL